MKHPTKESFLKDVKDHKLTIIKEEGIYRHLKFKGKDFAFHFDIITYPGGLLMRGDMGTWVFERTEDMFSFFRHYNGELEINPGYWAEKCQAESVFGNGIRVFDPDGFRECVRNHWGEYFEEDLESEEAIDVWESIEDHILCGEDAEWDLVPRLNDWSNHGLESDFDFTDFWENTVTTGTYHYLWACYAIAWAVIQYDKAVNNG